MPHHRRLQKKHSKTGPSHNYFARGYSEMILDFMSSCVSSAGNAIKNASPKPYTLTVWSDLPHRLATICVAVPVLWILWLNPYTRFSFFQGIHCIMCWEYLELTGLYDRKNPERMTSQHDTSDDSFIRKYLWFIFIMSSIILANIPTLDEFVLVFILIQAVLFLSLSSSSRDDTPDKRSAINIDSAYVAILSGFLLITIPCRCWLQVQQFQGRTVGGHLDGFYHVVSLLLTVWNCDTGALLFGRLLRSNKKKNPKISSRREVQMSREPLWLQRISPNKSMIGLLGGIVGGTATFCLLPTFWKAIHDYNILDVSSSSAFYSPYVSPQYQSFSGNGPANPQSSFGKASLLSFPHQHQQRALDHLWMEDEELAADAARAAAGRGPSLSTTLLSRYPILIGILLSVVAILGDLWESSIKRAYGVKDSSRLLPGHGGILDRFDSSLLAVLLYHFFLSQGII